MLIRLCCLILLLPCTALGAIHATDIRYAPGLEEISLHSERPLQIQQTFALPSPPRLVIDLNRIAHGEGVGLGKAYAGEMLQAIRFGQYNKSTSRIVLDLTQTELRYQTVLEPGLLRITLQSTKKTPAAITPSPTSALAATPVDFPLPVPRPEHLAKQAKKPVIVIDAGHGGKDSGARSRHGTIEKDITLSYARALRKALLRTGRYRVVMTRNDDRYLFLKERVEVARKMQGDAFLSLHADSNPRGDARGLSVYTLSETASDAEAAALAAQENKADIIGGMDLSVEDETVASILIDLAQRETNNKSSNLAETLIASIEPGIPLITNPHRYAGFRVLKAPDIPSVLVEVGFLSNRDDERRVKQPEYREKVIRSIIKALDEFFSKN